MRATMQRLIRRGAAGAQSLLRSRREASTYGKIRGTSNRLRNGAGRWKGDATVTASDFDRLEQLAAPRNFRIVRRGSLYWIVSLTTGLPEPNGVSLIFTFEEARAMLLALQET